MLGALSLPASLGLPPYLEPPAKPALLLPAGMVGQGPLTSRYSTCRGPEGPCAPRFTGNVTSTLRSGPNPRSALQESHLSLIY